MKIYKILILIILINLLIGCSTETPISKQSAINQTARVENCKILSNKLEVKEGAGTSFNTISTLNYGQTVNVIGKIEDWYVVKLDNNTVGCIKASETKPIIKNRKKERERLERNDPTAGRENQNKDKTNEPNGEENLTTLERRMANLVNQERKKNNLEPYTIDQELTNIARIKAQDMADNNYFSHYSPNYGSPFDMLNEFGVEYLRAGENIAANSSVINAHEALMKSSGHRKNILNPDFTHMGIGIKPSEKYGYLFVQLFISK